ncbi:MAG: hypothetical protein RR475_01745 [Clostridia bacterium]
METIGRKVAKVITRLKNNCKAAMPNTYQRIRKIWHWVRRPYDHIVYSEKHVSYGEENPDKTFYLIPSYQYASFGAVLNVPVLSGIRHALQRKWIPVLDFLSMDNWFIEKDEIGIVNGWEQYFFQPMDYSVGDVARSKHVIIPNKYFLYEGPSPCKAFFYNEFGMRDEWKKIYARYIRLKPEIEAYIEDKRKALHIEDGIRTVGVKCRGTDYSKRRTYGHQIQPDTASIIEQTQRVMQEYGCSKVFLSCEDEDIRRDFEAKLGAKLIMSEPAVEYDGCSILYGKETGKFQDNLEYLCSLAIVSRCTCIVATACGGSMVSALMAKNPEYEYYYCIGLYGIDDKNEEQKKRIDLEDIE